MWSGASGNIPTGWVICNGLNSTPNLLDRFIVGAGNAYTLHQTAGSISKQLTVDHLPPHTHDITIEMAGAHNHTISGTGTHEHINQAKGGVDTLSFAGGNRPPASGFSVNTWNVTQDGSDHIHGMNATGEHSHDISLAQTGNGRAFDVIPPYYTLSYIMKTL